ncbi:MAG: tRNA-uridine aminocarboxypropyltransferase [Polyangiaceae bacterium]
MTRRDNPMWRCTRCRMHGSICICSLVPTLATRTRVVLFIHRAEDRKPTNTGRLATMCLPNSEVHVRGNEESPSGTFRVPDDRQGILLFPSDDGVPIETFATCPKPVTLVVPDGNWRQASKVRQRVPGMAALPTVKLPAGRPSTYRLRSEAHDHGLATLEAIARALAVLEGPEVERSMLRVFDAMVERTLWSRGDLEAHEVEGGVPEGAYRHDPKSGLARDRAR